MVTKNTFEKLEAGAFVFVRKERAGAIEQEPLCVGCHKHILALRPQAPYLRCSVCCSTQHIHCINLFREGTPIKESFRGFYTCEVCAKRDTMTGPRRPALLTTAWQKAMFLGEKGGVVLRRVTARQEKNATPDGQVHFSLAVYKNCVDLDLGVKTKQLNPQLFYECLNVEDEASVRDVVQVAVVAVGVPLNDYEYLCGVNKPMCLMIAGTYDSAPLPNSGGTGGVVGFNSYSRQTPRVTPPYASTLVMRGVLQGATGHGVSLGWVNDSSDSSSSD